MAAVTLLSTRAIGALVARRIHETGPLTTDEYVRWLFDEALVPEDRAAIAINRAVETGRLRMKPDRAGVPVLVTPRPEAKQ